MFRLIEAIRDGGNMLAKEVDTPEYQAAVFQFEQRKRRAMSVLFDELEIIAFAGMIWLVIGAGYLLWSQIFTWLPDDSWNEITLGPLADPIIFAWAFLVVGLCSLPFSILSACIGVTHFLHRSRQPSSVRQSLRIVAPHAFRLWAFAWYDGWYTVTRPMRRFNAFMFRRSAGEEETRYMIWKVTTGCMPLAIISGRGLNDARKQAEDVLYSNLYELALLRSRYYASCWRVALSMFFIGAIFMGSIPEADGADIGAFYTWLSVPVAVGLGVLQLCVRPPYLLMAADIYADYALNQEKKLVDKPDNSRLRPITLLYLILVIAAVAGLLFHDALGIVSLMTYASL